MMHRSRSAIAIAAALLSLSCAATPASAATSAATSAALVAPASVPHAAFDRWADAFAADWVRLHPEQATVTQYFSGAEQGALDRQLDPQTPAQRARKLALAKRGLTKLDQWLQAPLDANQRIAAATMRWNLQTAIAGERYQDHRFLFSQFHGLHMALVSFMTENHPLRNAADVNAYLARLDQLGQRIDEGIAVSRAATARQLIPPRFILERAQAQVDGFLKPAPDANVLVAALAKRSSALADLTPQARDVALARATSTVRERILPAYTRLQSYLAELHPRTTDVAGLSRLPDGAAAYAQALANYTGTSLTAEQIHAIGLREVARIEGTMDLHLKSLGLVDGSIAERMAQLDARFQPPADSDPRPQLLARYADIVRDAERRSAAVFNLMPRAPVEVRREPALTEPSASAHYSTPAPDGSRPGVFWVPLRGPKFDMIRMRSLAYHEAVPGHHFQLAVQQELQGLPKFRTLRIFGGGSMHSEGWALYTERLAVEQGWYEGDVPGLLGALGSELFRAKRLVVDTGLHAKGWTRQQAIDYGIGAPEVERYVAWPGQACAYMTGMLRIIELREQAQAALGDKFSLAGFHDVVLRTGSVPLDVLAEVVQRWVAAQRG
ncbi:MAG: DUF885 family protein [Sphingomonadaceae bacterium]